MCLRVASFERLGFDLAASTQLLSTEAVDTEVRHQVEPVHVANLNRQLTTMWAIVFAATVPAHVMPGAIDTHKANLIFNWAIPIVLIIWAAKRTAAACNDAGKDAR